DHGGGAAGGLQVGDQLGLGGGQGTGDDLVDAGRGGHGLGGGGVVAGEQDGAQAQGAQRGHGAGGGGLNGVGDGYRALNLVVPADEDGGAASLLLGTAPRRQVGGDLGEQLGAADSDLVT